METKKCTKCNEEKPLSEFPKSINNMKKSRCRLCLNNYSKTHYQKNKDIYKEQHKKWREKNKELIKLSHAEYLKKNKERIIAKNNTDIEKEKKKIYQIEYHKKNKNYLVEQNRLWKEKNKENFNRTIREWSREKMKNPEYRRKVLDKQNEWRKKNKEKLKKRQHDEHINPISDIYVKFILKTQFNLHAEYCFNWMIELKRKIIQARRLIKNKLKEGC